MSTSSTDRNSHFVESYVIVYDNGKELKTDNLPLREAIDPNKAVNGLVQVAKVDEDVKEIKQVGFSTL